MTQLFPLQTPHIGLTWVNHLLETSADFWELLPHHLPLRPGTQNEHETVSWRWGSIADPQWQDVTSYSSNTLLVVICLTAVSALSLFRMHLCVSPLDITQMEFSRWQRCQHVPALPWSFSPMLLTNPFICITMLTAAGIVEEEHHPIPAKPHCKETKHIHIHTQKYIIKELS